MAGEDLAPRVDQASQSLQVEGPFHGPFPTGFERHLVLGSMERYDDVNVPLTGGDGIRFEKTFIEPRVDVTVIADFMTTAGEIATVKGDIESQTHTLKGLSGRLKGMVEEHPGLVGAYFRARNLVTNVFSKFEREVVDPQGFKEQLGPVFPTVASEHLRIDALIPENVRTRRGEVVSADMIAEIVRRGLLRRGIAKEDVDRMLAMKREIDVSDWQAVLELMHDGKVSASTVTAKPKPEVRVDAFQRTKGNK